MGFLELEDGQIGQAWLFIARIALLFIAYRIVATAYDVFFSPMSNFPGPKTFAASHIPLVWAICIGEEHSVKRKLHEKYGPVVRISPTALSYNTSEAWQDIYGLPKKGKGDLPKDPDFYRAPINEVRDIVNSIDDRNHRRIRKVLAPAFSERALKEQEPLLKQWAAVMVSKLKEKADAGEAADLVSWYNFTTFDIMGDLTFSESLYMLENSEYHPWFNLTFGFFKQLTIITSLEMFSGFSSLIKFTVAKLGGKTMREHFKFSADRADRRLHMTPDKPDFWSYIVRKGDDGLSVDELHSNSQTFMLAGTETSATLLSGLTYQLLQHPLEMHKIVEEVRTTFKSMDDVDLETLRNLPYMNACIEEAFRTYPPVPMGMPRITPKQGANIQGQWVPKGISVSVSQWSTYRSASNFALPNDFIPERWLSGDKRFENDDKAALQPFSVGPRDCIGRLLAYHESRIILCSLLWNFDLELDKRSDGWTNQKSYRLWVKPPLWVKLTERKD